jgi:hypothetical protein
VRMYNKENNSPKATKQPNPLLQGSVSFQPWEECKENHEPPATWISYTISFFSFSFSFLYLFFFILSLSQYE